MCGIAGLWTRGALKADDARVMADALSHRGPDDAGVWTDADAGIALAHRRLSILDPSPAGHQPMPSPCGRYVLSFNGEIYNHLALRRRLDEEGAIPWRGHSDSETLLHAICRWGLGEALRRAIGMFALAVWDREQRTLALARDRIGEKPLYVGWTGDAILFGSELKALRARPGFVSEIAPQALALYLRLNYVPAPWSILRHVFKVEPGTILTIGAQALGRPPTALPGEEDAQGVHRERFWSLDAVVDRGTETGMTADDAVAGFHLRLRDAVARQMVADMPVGAFLSGGLDSSAVVALMREVSDGPVRTFTIGFREPGFDEAPFAREVARHLGATHHELYVEPADVRDVIPDLPTIYDEPFADSSQLPSVLLSRLARQSVKVALTGDGGDELLCGYNRYLFPQKFWSMAGALPAPVRRSIGSTITAIAPARWDSLARAPLMPAISMAGVKAHKIGRMLQTPARSIDIYRAATEEWPDRLPLSAAFAPPSLIDERAAAGRTAEERMMRWDMTTYLPGDILTKLDRASMSVGLEARTPFLDHHVVQQAWRTPLAFKKRDGRGKWMLRQMLRRHLPDTLIDRPKAGFALPLGQWLRADLRDWGEALLGETALRDDPLLDGTMMRQRWIQHQNGSHDWTPSLWGVLMYRAWAATC